MIKNWFINSKTEQTHPTEEDLLRSLDGELPAKHSVRVRSHLEMCWNCRLRLEKIEETISAFVGFRQKIQVPLTGAPPKNWSDFGNRLRDLPRAKPAARVSRADWFASIRFSRVSQLWILPIFAIALIAVVLFTFFPNRTVSASDLLRRSEMAERALGKVVHMKVSIKRTSPDQSGEVEYKTIDEWSNNVSGDKLRRIYNGNGDLVLITKISDGKISNFTSEKPMPRMTLIPVISPQMARLQRLREGGLSGKEFQNLIGDPNQAKVEERPDSYAIKFSDKDGGFSATLVLQKGTLRPVSEHLEFKLKDKSYVYDFIESSFELLEPDAVNWSVFEVDQNYHETSSRRAE